MIKNLVTQGANVFPFNCKKGLVVTINDDILMKSLNYFYKKATLEKKHFLDKKLYKNVSREKGGILPSQEFNGKLNLSLYGINNVILLCTIDR